MANTGNVFAGAGANVDRGGTSNVWGSPGNVTADDGTSATVNPVPSDYLVCSSFGFAIPTGSLIQGVTVRIEASETGSGSSTYVPQLISATTPTLIGSAKSAITISVGPTISTSGSTSDLWGATLTPAIVNAAGFGVAIWSTDTTNVLSVDFVTIAIEYLPPYSLTATATTQSQTSATAVVTQHHTLTATATGGSQTSATADLTPQAPQAFELVADASSQAQVSANADISGPKAPSYTRLGVMATPRPYISLQAGVFELEADATTQAQASATVSLAQHHVLAAQGSAQGQTSETLGLTQTHSLIASNSAQGHSAEAVGLTQAHTLGVDASSQSQTSEEAEATEHEVGAVSLTALDTSQGQTSDEAGLTGTGPIGQAPQEQPSGGWLNWQTQYEIEQARRRRERAARKRLEEETESIKEQVDREIARLLRTSEAKDSRREELQRLRGIANHLQAPQASQIYGPRVASALERAITQGNYSSLAALDRELERAQEDEDFLLLAVTLLLDD